MTEPSPRRLASGTATTAAARKAMGWMSGWTASCGADMAGA